MDAALKAGWLELVGGDDYDELKVVSKVRDSLTIDVAAPAVVAESESYAIDDIQAFLKSPELSKFWAGDPNKSSNWDLWKLRATLARGRPVDASTPILNLASQRRGYEYEYLAYIQAAVDRRAGSTAAILPLSTATLERLEPRPTGTANEDDVFLLITPNRPPEILHRSAAFTTYQVIRQRLSAIFGDKRPDIVLIGSAKLFLPLTAGSKDWFDALRYLPDDDPLYLDKSLWDRTYLNLVLAYQDAWVGDTAPFRLIGGGPLPVTDGLNGPLIDVDGGGYRAGSGNLHRAIGGVSA